MLGARATAVLLPSCSLWPKFHEVQFVFGQFQASIHARLATRLPCATVGFVVATGYPAHAHAHRAESGRWFASVSLVCVGQENPPICGFFVIDSKIKITAPFGHDAPLASSALPSNPKRRILPKAGRRVRPGAPVLARVFVVALPPRAAAGSRCCACKKKRNDFTGQRRFAALHRPSVGGTGLAAAAAAARFTSPVLP